MEYKFSKMIKKRPIKKNQFKKGGYYPGPKANYIKKMQTGYFKGKKVTPQLAEDFYEEEQKDPNRFDFRKHEAAFDDEIVKFPPRRKRGERAKMPIDPKLKERYTNLLLKNKILEAKLINRLNKISKNIGRYARLGKFSSDELYDIENFLRENLVETY